MAGWNGGRGSSWSYRQDIGSDGSNSSGTIASRLSTAYASSGSWFSTFSMEAAMHFDSLGIHEELDLGIQDELDGDKMDDREEAEEEEEETREDRSRRRVQRFFSVQSANCSSIKLKRDDMSLVERWVILSLEGNELDRDARSWVRALDTIAQTICFTRPHFADGTNLLSICEEQGKHVGVRCIPDRYHLALVIPETMLKILTFVDIVVALVPNTTEEFHSVDRVMLPPYVKLISLLGALGALSEASYMIRTQIHGSTSVEIKRIEKEMTILLSAYENKLGETIRSTMEKIRMMSMEDGNDSSIPLNPQGSSDIHKVTRSVMTCLRFVRANYSSVDSALRGKSVPHIENMPPLDDMIIQMVSCLQGKLVNISQSISDQGLRSLFLLNNSYFIQEFQHFYYCLGLNHQIEGHMERYLQVSWPPLLSCLFNTMPLCLGKNYSPLSKFEAEFQKIYTTQKQWKVPDPRLRRELRRFIIYKIIPRYKRYIEDNKITNPKFSPQELVGMLQDLFEG